MPPTGDLTVPAGVFMRGRIEGWADCILLTRTSKACRYFRRFSSFSFERCSRLRSLERKKWTAVCVRVCVCVCVCVCVLVRGGTGRGEIFGRCLHQ